MQNVITADVFFIYGEEDYKIERVAFNVIKNGINKSIFDQRHVISCPQCKHLIKYSESEYRYHNLEASDELTKLYYKLWKNNNRED